MASYLYVFKLNTAEQPDLFYSDGDKLSLDKIQDELEPRQAPIDNQASLMVKDLEK
ncbi:MAG: hypothetical protein ACQEUS_12725 [Bacillota bacterium]